ncbi:hypothetical protein RB597_008661 [Gaeumannomyces tritici]
MSRERGRSGSRANPGGQRNSESYDEHTRLLPNRLDSDVPTYLNPDDPAVTPYNLWTVRLMRWVTVVFAMIAFLWWILQLVSIFITPPGLHTRGSVFFAFGYSTVSLAILAVALLFFAVPSKSIRVLSGVLSGLLIVDAIIILSVTHLRREETFVGSASVIWAFFTAVWTLLADEVVQWGKREEEERLTGRPETRRTLLEWTEVGISSIVIFVLCIAASLMTCTLFIRAVDSGLQPPGTRHWVDADKYQIHIFCAGNSTELDEPTVLIEGGEEPVENGLWQFADNAVRNGSMTRYCFADRPGFAWSDTAPSPLTVGMATDALSEALARAGERGPWILMSAGVGSLYSRVFSSRHGKETRGILMIDPTHEDLLSRTADPGRGFLLWARGVLAPLGLKRIPGAVFGGRSREDRVWGRSASQGEKYIFAKLQEGLVANSLSKREVVASRAIQYRKTPLAIVSSGVQIRQDSEWEAKQRDLGRLTRNLVSWDIEDEAPHQVWKTFKGRELLEKRLAQLVRA